MQSRLGNAAWVWPQMCFVEHQVAGRWQRPDSWQKPNHGEVSRMGITDVLSDSFFIEQGQSQSAIPRCKLEALGLRPQIDRGDLDSVTEL